MVLLLMDSSNKLFYHKFIKFLLSMELSMMKKMFLMALIASLVASILMAQEVKPGKVEVIDLGKGIKLELVFIPAGKFKMGSPETERGRQKNESQHEVTITKSFLIGKYEVTQEQWEVLMGKNPSVNVGPRLPVTNVSWVECQEFIKVLNLKTKGEYRLPTESEWEYACRAGTNTATAFGETITSKDANYDESKIEEEYGIKPVQLIQVKGLMGDASDNIPGVPGVGEKTALKLIKEYQNIDKLYEELEIGNTTIKGALKEKLTNNKESSILSIT